MDGLRAGSLIAVAVADTHDARGLAPPGPGARDYTQLEAPTIGLTQPENRSSDGSCEPMATSSRPLTVGAPGASSALGPRGESSVALA